MLTRMVAWPLASALSGSKPVSPRGRMGEKMPCFQHIAQTSLSSAPGRWAAKRCNACCRALARIGSTRAAMGSTLLRVSGSIKLVQ